MFEPAFQATLLLAISLPEEPGKTGAAHFCIEEPLPPSALRLEVAKDIDVDGTPVLPNQATSARAISRGNLGIRWRLSVGQKTNRFDLLFGFLGFPFWVSHFLGTWKGSKRFRLYF